MAVPHQITTENIQRLAFVAGYKGVADLARSLRRNRVTVWRAVKDPQRYGPTFSAIKKALHIPA